MIQENKIEIYTGSLDLFENFKKTNQNDIISYYHSKIIRKGEYTEKLLNNLCLDTNVFLELQALKRPSI